jgi:biofilm PGA synthesis N-glycosyltransferase PgaC
MNFDPFSVWEIIAAIGLIAMLVQLFHYLVLFSRLSFYKVPVRQSAAEPVTVIICARNELKNLKANLESVLTQDYPDFQVVVVNDCSWDESGKYLEEIQPQYPNLKIVTINEQEKYRHGKKFALSLGIKAASHDILLMTDADCQPMSKNWIRTMVSGYRPGTEIVIGYGAYRKEPGLLNKWVRMDTVFNAVQYLSAALRRNTYMGVGRNLSYRKSLFFKNKGFASHNHIMSGDDDLFVNETARPDNTIVELQQDSFTGSSTRNTFGGWLKQKKRHMSTGNFYKSGHKMLIASFFLSQFMFYAVAITLLVAGFQPVWVLSAIGLRLLVQLTIFGTSMKKLGEIDIIWMLPVFDIIVVLLYPSLSISNLLFKDKTWR